MKGNYPKKFFLGEVPYQKVTDLRYGTNPHQSAAYYKGFKGLFPIANMKIIKSGKNGLSQTNLEDISYALNICKYFNNPCSVIMKHVNPCGFSQANSTTEAYKKAYTTDPRAAFGKCCRF